jgi:hypothetical protein
MDLFRPILIAINRPKHNKLNYSGLVLFAYPECGRNPIYKINISVCDFPMLKK